MMQLPQIAEPTREEIAEWHGRYVERLCELHAISAKHCYGAEDDAAAKRELEV